MNEFVALVCSLSAFWFILHLIRYRSNIPTPTRPATFTLSLFSFHYSTTRFNQLPKRFISLCKLNARTWASFYNVGAIVGVIGVAVAQVVLFISAFASCRVLYRMVTQESKALVKRAIVLGSTRGSRDALLLRPIIPGVTLPLSSLPLLLLALFSSQLFHEFGHALAAYLEGIETLSMGIYLYLFLPTFYVSLPASTISSSTSSVYALSSALSELKIATAGIYHNLVLCFIIYLLQDSGLGFSSFLSSWAYGRNEGGLLIVEVDSSSPLRALLSPWTTLTHFGDIELDSTDAPVDQWTQYLTATTDEDDYSSLGYCLSSSSFRPTTFDSHEKCCFDSTLDTTTQHPLCFSSRLSSSGIHSACLSPLSFFPPSNSIPFRCVDDRTCHIEGELCARISRFENVTRIGVKDENDMERVVIWQGDRHGILSAVKVSAYRPRFFWIPIGFAHQVQEFYFHLYSLSLTLAFFNLLPLPHLDGTVILESFLLVLSSQSPSALSFIEAGESSTNRSKDTVLSSCCRVISRWIGGTGVHARDQKRTVRILGRWTIVVGGVLLLSTAIVEFVL